MTPSEAMVIVSAHDKSAFWDCVSVALSKQIPAKPFHSGLSYDCPRCLEEVGKITLGGRIYKNHHCECGQSIDWSWL